MCIYVWVSFQIGMLTCEKSITRNNNNINLQSCMPCWAFVMFSRTHYFHSFDFFLLLLPSLLANMRFKNTFHWRRKKRRKSLRTFGEKQNRPCVQSKTSSNKVLCFKTTFTIHQFWIRRRFFYGTFLPHMNTFYRVSPFFSRKGFTRAKMYDFSEL